MGLRLKLMVLAGAFLIVPYAHAARLYKWIDKDGNVSYHDERPSEAGYRVEEKDLGDDSASTDAGSQDAAAKAPVVLYTAPGCTLCDTARAYLKNRGVPFTEKNVQGDRQAQNELIKRAGGVAVPTITIGKKVMKGYLESLLAGELDAAGYPKAANQGSAAQEKPAS